MRILVTGGCGFIGSHLVEELIRLGHEVVVLDRVKGNAKAEYIIGDINNIDDVKKAVSGCDVVYHLAALIDLRSTGKEEDYKVNYLGAKTVFDAARRKKIIFTSTSAVYGDAPLPLTEESPVNPISYYAENKLRAERLLQEISDNAFITRFFNVYGPGAKSFLNAICERIKTGEVIDVYGDGSQTRDYVYITDIVSSLILGLKNSGIYNVGTGIETSVMDIIRIAEKISGKKPNIIYEPSNPREVKRSVTSIDKIKKLGWEPKVSLEEGMRRILEQ